LEAAQAEQSTLTLDQAVAREDLPFEFMMNALRLTGGFQLAEFNERTGMPITAIRATLDAAEAKGLIQQSLHHVQPTTRGLDFLSDLQAMFLPN
jgi:coproporphyrinogen III oxidase-like Fe-S oxidoreductase